MLHRAGTYPRERDANIITVYLRRLNILLLMDKEREIIFSLLKHKFYEKAI
jgi:hypothetical protein